MTNTLNRALKSFVCISSLFLMGSALAHQVWLEPDGNQTKLYFGEFNENLRETSPGRLDAFVKLAAQKLSGTTREDMVTTKTPDGFAIAARLAKGESLIAQDAAYPIRERKDGDKTERSLYVPAARLMMDTSVQIPQLTLDVVPTGKIGKTGNAANNEVELQVFFKGQPLAKAKVAVVTASGWMQELRSQDDGKLMVAMPWAGRYVIEVKHLDAAGERGLEKYDKANYVTSLTLQQAQGLPALPALPAVVPSPMK